MKFDSMNFDIYHAFLNLILTFAPFQYDHILSCCNKHATLWVLHLVYVGPFYLLQFV